MRQGVVDQFRWFPRRPDFHDSTAGNRDLFAHCNSGWEDINFTTWHDRRDTSIQCQDCRGSTRNKRARVMRRGLNISILSGQSK